MWPKFLKPDISRACTWVKYIVDNSRSNGNMYLATARFNHVEILKHVTTHMIFDHTQ